MKRPSLGTLLRILVAVALTGLLLWKAHPGKVWEASVHADLTCIGIAVALTFLDRALMAYRWLVLLRPLASASHVSLGPIMRIFFVSTFVGTFLPASIGGDAVRAYSLARHDVPASAAVASVFMDRMLGVLSVLMLGAAGLVFARDLATHPAILTALAVTLVICAGTALVVFSRGMADLARRVLRVIPSPAIRRIGDSLLSAVRSYATSHRELLNVLVGSLGVQVLRVVQAYYLGRALGIDVPLSIYFAFVPLILLVMLLPVTVNGIGTSQAAFVWLFSRAGVGGPQAFALSVLFVALGVVGNLPGALLYVKSGLDPARAASGDQAVRG